VNRIFESTDLAFDTNTGLRVAACHNGVARLVHSRTGKDRGSVRIAGQSASTKKFHMLVVAP
jgi:hypothetical protein